jgi:hypothetical protein
MTSQSTAEAAVPQTEYQRSIARHLPADRNDFNWSAYLPTQPFVYVGIALAAAWYLSLRAATNQSPMSQHGDPVRRYRRARNAPSMAAGGKGAARPMAQPGITFPEA